MLKNERVWQFIDGLSDSTPTPGGGSASALSGAMAASLVSMVSRLTIESPKYACVHREMRRVLVSSEKLRAELLSAVDRDTDAFKAVMAAYRMPKETDVQKKVRSKAIEKALKKATVVPLEVANDSLIVLELAEVLSERGNTNAMSDVGVAGLLADTAIRGAIYNVKINIRSMKKNSSMEKIVIHVGEMLEVSSHLLKKIEKNVNAKISQ